MFDGLLINSYRLIFKEEPTPAFNNFIKSLGFVSLGFGVSAILGLVTQILAGRILGPLEYGKYGFVQAAASFLSLPMVMGITTALVKYGAEKDDFAGRKKIISTSYLLFGCFSLISLIILSVLSRLISGILGMSMEMYIYTVIFSFVYSAYIISIAVAQGLKEMKALSILQIIYGVSGIIAFLLMIFFKFYTFKAILFASILNYFIEFIKPS